ncbi:hypothetical protein LCY76_22170 [Fictibacillus sp. KIGAM418]|uniref:Uncharacterized protein n=1 Tax=Fictibacillus marinisediminis TaxID=2878389 RepID=A0A9X2BFZ7_9BACL|nr:hypothetical protein [Fictibacillus marinisediminis]MCK6259285.1 hypothetical protein [Fictibacillus marinisediminis]
MEQSVYLIAIILFTVNVMFQKAVSLMITRVEQAILVKEQKYRVVNLLAKAVKKKERPLFKPINNYKQERRKVKWIDTS